MRSRLVHRAEPVWRVCVDDLDLASGPKSTLDTVHARLSRVLTQPLGEKDFRFSGTRHRGEWEGSGTPQSRFAPPRSARWSLRPGNPVVQALGAQDRPQNRSVRARGLRVIGAGRRAVRVNGATEGKRCLHP